MCIFFQGDPFFDEQIKETVNKMIDQNLADEVRNQIKSDSLLPVDTLVPSIPRSAASVVTVMDKMELQVSIVRLVLTHIKQCNHFSNELTLTLFFLVI